jgi:hypothetical protein
MALYASHSLKHILDATPRLASYVTSHKAQWDSAGLLLSNFFNNVQSGALFILFWAMYRQPSFNMRSRTYGWRQIDLRVWSACLSLLVLQGIFVIWPTHFFTPPYSQPRLTNVCRYADMYEQMVVGADQKAPGAM